MKLLVEELKDMYAVLDDAIQNSDYTDYVQGLMSKEEEKAYLDDEWERLTGKEEGKE